MSDQYSVFRMQSTLYGHWFLVHVQVIVVVSIFCARRWIQARYRSPVIVLQLNCLDVISFGCRHQHMHLLGMRYVRSHGVTTLINEHPDVALFGRRRSEKAMSQSP